MHKQQAPTAPRPIGQRWRNPETQAAFRDALSGEWEDDMDVVAADWLAAYGPQAPRLWGKQLRRDFLDAYGGAFADSFVGSLLCQGFNRVDFLQLAVRLLARVQPADERGLS